MIMCITLSMKWRQMFSRLFPKQSKKEHLYQLILDSKKNIFLKFKNKAEITEIKKSTNHAIKILDDLGETYVEI